MKITTFKNKITGLGTKGKVKVPKDQTLLPKRKIDPRKLSQEIVITSA
jgi:hypothetical protein